MTKTVLILGALAGQADAVEVLRSRDLEIHMCGHVQSGPGVTAADKFHVVDITDVAAVTDLARKINADLVYSVGSDIAMPTVVQVSERLGLPHFHGSALTDVLRKKELLRSRLDAAGLSPVRFAAVERDAAPPSWQTYPCIVKPVDAQGQRGITVVREPEALAAAVEHAKASSISGPVIIEEFLEGPEVSAHVIVREGDIEFFLPSDRHVWEGPLVGVPQAHSLPLMESTQKWAGEFRALVTSIVKSLGVQEGPLYVQSIFTEQGPKIVEIASRLDGCHLWRMIEQSTGINVMDILLGRLLGTNDLEFPKEYTVSPATLRFYLDDPGVSVDDDYVSRVRSPEATFVQIQLEDDGRPRRTNDVVARIGYEVVPE